MAAAIQADEIKVESFKKPGEAGSLTGKTQLRADGRHGIARTQSRPLADHRPSHPMQPCGDGRQRLDPFSVKQKQTVDELGLGNRQVPRLGREEEEEEAMGLGHGERGGI